MNSGKFRVNVNGKRADELSPGYGIDYGEKPIMIIKTGTYQ